VELSSVDQVLLAGLSSATQPSQRLALLVAPFWGIAQSSQRLALLVAPFWGIAQPSQRLALLVAPFWGIAQPAQRLALLVAPFWGIALLKEQVPQLAPKTLALVGTSLLAIPDVALLLPATSSHPQVATLHWHQWDPLRA